MLRIQNDRRQSLASLRLPLVDVQQMRAIDALATRDRPDEGYRLMGLAAKALFRKIMEVVPHPGEAAVAIFVGGGNNGGDGLVLARLLHQVKMRHQVYGMVPPEALRGEAARALSDYRQLGGHYIYLESLEELFNKDLIFTLAVDAMLGLGQEGSPRGKYAELVRRLNQWNVPVLAVDCPTGFDSQAGVPGDPCLRVRWTVMMGYPRLEAFCIPGGDFFGETEVAPLDYSDEVVHKCHAHNYWLPPKAFAHLLPQRNDWGDKRVQGYAAIVAGSSGMSGAATLCAQAALRSGVGMVNLASPDCILPALACKLTEPVLHALPCNGQGLLDPSHLPKLEALCDRSDAICIGPGLSTQASVRDTVRQLIKRVRKPIVLDADGLNAIAGEPSLLRLSKNPVVLTPHVGEWARLFGPAPLTPSGTLEAVREKAQEYGVVIVLKGPPTFIGTPAGEVYLMPNANSGMAKGGSGDVLAGLITSMLAQGMEPEEAALMGVHLHNRAGHFALQEHGAFCMQPSDMITQLPKAFQELLSSVL
jgi:ADP-dependent NAD(P)H-hydrate dehydratase / NAD(P)H-hydrate epimerase